MAKHEKRIRDSDEEETTRSAAKIPYLLSPEQQCLILQARSHAPTVSSPCACLRNAINRTQNSPDGQNTDDIRRRRIKNKDKYLEGNTIAPDESSLKPFSDSSGLFSTQHSSRYSSTTTLPVMYIHRSTTTTKAGGDGGVCAHDRVWPVL